MNFAASFDVTVATALSVRKVVPALTSKKR
jgi:hypothetical protein